jgi:hypothetical protein
MDASASPRRNPAIRPMRTRVVRDIRLKS